MSAPQQPTRDQVAAVAAAGRLAEAEAYGRLAEATRRVSDADARDSVPLDRESLEAEAAAARRERERDGVNARTRANLRRDAARRAARRDEGRQR